MSPSHSTSEPTTAAEGRPDWRQRYGQRHRLERVKAFPAGATAPKKVRLYRRQDHFIVQWWDPQTKRTLSTRVSGDLIDALIETRKIEARLVNYKTAGGKGHKLDHDELVERFLVDLRRRTDAGELAVSTIARYRTALVHYQRFCERPEIRKAYPTSFQVNREFRLAFSAWLMTSRSRRAVVPANALLNGPVLDAVRAMFNWAQDPDRGNLMPEGFRNPFERAERTQRQAARDPFGEPDVTVSMAVDFIRRCDAFQLPLFATLIMFGLRASEPIYLFREHLDHLWLKLPCLPELDYLTKGQRDKRFPLTPLLASLLRLQVGGRSGFIFLRRSTTRAVAVPHRCGGSLTAFTDEFVRRCQSAKASSAVVRQQIREQLVREAGGLNYDQIEHEFQSVAKRLGWPRTATLKDFRHLFSTALENSGVPLFYRRYFMGQSPGKAAIVTYTHLNQLQAQFAKALTHDLAQLAEAIAARAAELHLIANPVLEA